jgi:hypothetical protein
MEPAENHAGEQLFPIAPARPAPPPAQALAEPLPAVMRARRVQRRTVTGVQLAGIAAVAAVLAIAGFLLLRPGEESASPTNPRAASAPTESRTVPVRPAPPAPGATAAPGSGSSTPPAAAPARPAPQPRALRLVLAAVRPVWIRVTVDGRRSIEREVPAGFRTTIDADRAVAIRAGDAGALNVGVNGAAEAPLGRTGQVATRIFTAPAER